MSRTTPFLKLVFDLG